MPTGEPEAKHKGKRLHKNAPAIPNLDQLIVRITGGCDLSQLPCLTSYSIMQIIAEVGTDMTRWNSPSTLRLGWGWPPVLDKAEKLRRSQPRFLGKAGRLFCVVSQSLAQSKDLALGGFIAAFEADVGVKSPILPPPANWRCCSITL